MTDINPTHELEAAGEAESTAGASTSSTSEHTTDTEIVPGGARGNDRLPAVPEAQEDDERGNPNAEAARYRKQLRATEAERDGARDHVAELQRAYIELLVEPRLQKADDFGRHVDMASLVAEDGKLDRVKIEAELEALLRERPYLAAKAKVRPAGIPKMRKGVPVEGEAGSARPPNFSARDFGRDDVKWNDLLHRDGEHAPTRGSGSRKLDSEVHKE
jgi:hypothetical protein